MKNIYIFDVDGTLTPTRKMMTDDFVEFFKNLSKENIFYLVSGSDLKKMKEQEKRRPYKRITLLWTPVINTRQAVQKDSSNSMRFF